MAKYLLLSADNIGTDIDVEIFNSKKEAKKAMESAFEAVKDDIGDGCETEFEKKSASVFDPITNNMFYWNVKKIEV